MYFLKGGVNSGSYLHRRISKNYFFQDKVDFFFLFHLKIIAFCGGQNCKDIPPRLSYGYSNTNLDTAMERLDYHSADVKISRLLSWTIMEGQSNHMTLEKEEGRRCRGEVSYRVEVEGNIREMQSLRKAEHYTVKGVNIENIKKIGSIQEQIMTDNKQMGL